MECIKDRCDGALGLRDTVPLGTDRLGHGGRDTLVLIGEPIGALASPMACIRPPALEASIMIAENLLLLVGELHSGQRRRGRGR